MARVIRLDPGGSSKVEKIGLSLEQAKELAHAWRPWPSHRAVRGA